MESWEHCAKTWYLVDIGFAIENINNKSIVKCEMPDDKEYIFNIGKPNPELSAIQMRASKWYVYTWSD